jgi:hypothetical protein
MTNIQESAVKDSARRHFLKGCAAVVGGSMLLAAADGALGSSAYAADVQAAAQASPSAEELVATIRDELKEIDDQIQNHKYLSALQKKRVSVEALQAFPGHEYHTVLSDLRSFAQLVQRFGHDPLAGPFFNGVLQGEIAGLPAIERMAAKLGMTKVALVNYEVTPEGFTYPTYTAWQSLYGSAAAVTCGLLVNFAAWGHNCGVMSQALQQHYGFSAEETAFLDDFATLPPFDEEALPIIQAGLNQGVVPAEIHRTARLFQAYEKMFWDTLATIAKL